ncbi:MAG: DUF3784 domain-containing protein [Oscillospiraceae bacterium]
MIIYSIIMFAMALLMIVVGILVYRGKTELIHDYHQTKVTDKKAYGKAMGKALAGISVPLVTTGIVAFFTASVLPTLVLIVGIIISLISLILVQKKYNGRLF